MNQDDIKNLKKLASEKYEVKIGENSVWPPYQPYIPMPSQEDLSEALKKMTCSLYSKTIDTSISCLLNTSSTDIWIDIPGVDVESLKILITSDKSLTISYNRDALFNGMTSQIKYVSVNQAHDFKLATARISNGILKISAPLAKNDVNTIPFYAE